MHAANQGISLYKGLKSSYYRWSNDLIIMSGILVLCLLISVVAGESMHGVSRERIVKEEHLLHDIPQMSEWNYENPECRFISIKF